MAICFRRLENSARKGCTMYISKKLGDSLWDYYPVTYREANGPKRAYQVEADPNRTWYFTYDTGVKNHPKYGQKTIRTDGRVICYFTPSEVVEGVFYVRCIIKGATYVQFETSVKKYQYFLAEKYLPADIRRPNKKKPRRGTA